MALEQKGQIVSPQSSQSEVEIEVDHSPTNTEPLAATPKTEPPKTTVRATEKSEGAIENDSHQDSTSKPEPSTTWQFNELDEVNDTEGLKPVTALTSPISWTASEFIHHTKTGSWYARLALASAVLAGLVFLLTHDKISTGAVIFAALVFGFYASRKPRTLEYKLDNSGISIGQKTYAYEHFKSFALNEEGAFFSIVLLPLKRFSPSLSIYFDPKDETRIVDALADRLPFDEHHMDAVDHLMRRIHY